VHGDAHEHDHANEDAYEYCQRVHERNRSSECDLEHNLGSEFDRDHKHYNYAEHDQ
jgi:hypothetical protein